MPKARDILHRLSDLVCGLTTLARLCALRALAEPSLETQRDAARAAAARMEQANALDEFIVRHYGRKARGVQWPAAWRPDVFGSLRDGEVVIALLCLQEDALGGAIAAEIHALEMLAGPSELNDPLCEHLAALLEMLPGPNGVELRLECPDPPGGARQVLRGPATVGMDHVFKGSFSVFDRNLPAQPDSARTASPHFWCLALRESMASELCALCMIEYDGLPLAFYRDMAKQAWDEARHARFFLHCAFATLPEYVASASGDDPLLPDARNHLETGSGLPVPREGNLYGAIWAAHLDDRLVLMHLDSESPGVAEFRRQRQLPYIRQHPEISEGLEVAALDEASHARLGRRWLDHLHPTPEGRAAAIERAMLLRGVFILSAVAQSRGQSLASLL